MTERDPSAATAKQPGAQLEPPRTGPSWFNPATIKGTVMIVASLILLIAPDVSAVLIRVVVGVGLVVSGASDLWFKTRGKAEGKLRGAIEAIIAMVTGAALLAWPQMTVMALILVAAVYLAARGLIVVATSARQHSHDDPWLMDLSRGLFLISLAAITLVIPEAVISGVIAAAAAVSIVVGAIVFSYGQSHAGDSLADIDAASVSRLVLRWIDQRDVGSDRREEIGDGLFFEQPGLTGKLVAWWVMLLLSVAIATFGVMQDSTAVVIGAMLIAPLMTPILGAAAGIVNAWMGRIGASLSLVAAGVAAAIGLAFVIGQWLPSIVPLVSNSQVTSRISPNLVDMMIALAAGAAGAYANVDRRVSNSIAGVAIAVALVPPLAVVGLTLQAGLFADSFGAFLLFLTNFVSIILAASGVFLLTGFAAMQRLRSSRDEVGIIVRTVVFAGLVILVPLIFTAEGVLSNAGRQSATQTAVDDWLGEDSDLRALRIEVDGTRVEVFTTGPGEIPPVEDLEDAITEAFGTSAAVRVEHAVTHVINYSDETGRTEAGFQTGDE